VLVKGERNGVVSDQDLLLRCRQGSVGAWHQLLNKYEGLVYSIPLRYGLSRDDAADIAQITFTILIQSLDSLSENSRLGPWLVTVARRHTWRLLQRNRRESSNEHLEGTDIAESAVLLGKSDADSTEHWELSEWLEAGLSKLGEPCRELLLALYFQPERSSYAEVAERLGRPVGSIGPTRARCLKRLRQVLGGG
jgi:RNA polymerase sigma factor (sigma-70 family)